MLHVVYSTRTVGEARHVEGYQRATEFSAGVRNSKRVLFIADNVKAGPTLVGPR